MNNEYIIWGIPPGQTAETVLFTKAKTPKEAEEVKKLLENTHNCTGCRIQVVDFSTSPDFISTLNSNQPHQTKRDGNKIYAMNEIQKLRTELKGKSFPQRKGFTLVIVKTGCDFTLQSWSDDELKYGYVVNMNNTVSEFVEFY